MPDPEVEMRFLQSRLDTMSRCAKEAIRREIELLRKLQLPIYVAENGRIIDLNALREPPTTMSA